MHFAHFALNTLHKAGAAGASQRWCRGSGTLLGCPKNDNYSHFFSSESLSHEQVKIKGVAASALRGRWILIVV
jgi:hypothetical protein